MLKNKVRISIITKSIKRIIEMEDLKFAVCVNNELTGNCDIYNVTRIDTIMETITIMKNGQEVSMSYDNIIDIIIKDETPCFLVSGEAL